MRDKMYNEKCDTFHAKYKVLEKIGEGSFSEVLKCINKSTGSYYAAKKLKKCYKSESAIVTCAEIVAAQKVPFHPNILNIFEYHYDSFSGQVTFIFELMDMSLYDHLRARNKSDIKRGLSEHKSKEYLYQLLRGLEHLHRNGLFHRDVKPENILMKFPSIESMRLQKIRKYEVIKLADLGSVRGIYSIPPYTEYISTRWYRSPECLLSNGNYGPKMDVWAAGCVFYEIMTLLPLFPGSNEIDQLYKIHHVLGSPTMQFINKLKSRSRNCVVFPKTRGTGLDALLAHVTRETRGILELMIEYDPDKRVNVRRLLKNSYFDDIRYKFEPTMEGNNYSQLRSQSYQKMPEYGKRTIGDVSGVKQKIAKREHKSDDGFKRRSNHGSSSSDSKGSTPFIEIPYYIPCRSGGSKGKSGSLPLVDYKISRYIDSSQVTSSESGKSNMSRNSSIKKSVEIILKSSRNSDTTKHSRSKEKYDASVFHSKSLMVPRSNRSGYQASSKRESSRIKSSAKNSSKYSKPSSYFRVVLFRFGWIIKS